MNLITAKLETSNARPAASVTAGTIGGPPVSPAWCYLHGGVYDLTNRVDHELGLLLVYVMTAVGVRDVPGAWHLAHEIGPGIHKSIEEQLAELLRFFGRHRQRAVLDEGIRSIGSSAESTIRGIGFRGAAANACSMFR